MIQAAVNEAFRSAQELAASQHGRRHRAGSRANLGNLGLPGL